MNLFGNIPFEDFMSCNISDCSNIIDCSEIDHGSATNSDDSTNSDSFSNSDDSINASREMYKHGKSLKKAFNQNPSQNRRSRRRKPESMKKLRDWKSI